MPAHYDILKNTEIYLTNVHKRPLLIYYSFSNRQQRCEPVIKKCGENDVSRSFHLKEIYLKLTFWSVLITSYT